MIGISLIVTFIFIFILISLLYYLRLKFNNKKFKLFIINNRVQRIHLFEKIAENVLSDILSALKETNIPYEQVHAILPLLSDIRKHGDKLAKQRKFYHTILFAGREQKLAAKIRRLHYIEIFLKSLSRHPAEVKNNILSSVLRKAGPL